MTHVVSVSNAREWNVSDLVATPILDIRLLAARTSSDQSGRHFLFQGMDGLGWVGLDAGLEWV